MCFVFIKQKAKFLKYDVYLEVQTRIPPNKILEVIQADITSLKQYCLF